MSEAFSDKGASSAIVLGGKFVVYGKTDFEGLNASLSADRYPTPAEMRMSNDTVKSITKEQ